MRKKPLMLAVLSALLLVVILSGCGGQDADTETPPADTPVPQPTAEPTAETVYGEANVESVQVMLLESFPVQVHVVARGQLPDGCTEIDLVSSNREADTYQVSITTVRPGDAVCTQAMVDFEEIVALDVAGLDAGQYQVTVNGIGGSFTLDMDNRLDAAAPEATATTPAETNTASISGRIWHDLCSVVPAVGDLEAVVSEGCAADLASGGFSANGLLENGETGIGGVIVELGEGACPASPTMTSVTDANGAYSFTGLRAGEYCVMVDALNEANSAVLVPGRWTAPDADLDSTSVELEDGGRATRINFGWDYQFLPVPEVDAETCVNSIQFVEDLSIPDDTLFEPGQELEKGWRLRNIGTCVWTPEYSLVKVGGDGIPGPESLPLPSTVVPGQTIDLSVTLTAPEVLGTYRDNWQLSSPTGVIFGVDGFPDEPFWLQIVVAEAQPTPVPNSAVIGGVVWRDSCFIQNDGSPSRGCIETEEGSGVYIADGSLNFGESRIAELEITLSSGVCPAEGAIQASSIITTTLTDAQGLYRFPGLDGGSFCVSIDALSEANVELLIPGDWTWPARGVGRFTVLLDPGEQLLETDFGWDDR